MARWIQIVRKENCDRCLRSFRVVNYHSKNKCRSCYNKIWIDNKRGLDPDKNLKAAGKTYTDQSGLIKIVEEKCLGCKLLWNSINDKGKKVVLQASGMCRACYNINYKLTSSFRCKRCGNDMGKKIKGICSLCKIEIESYKPPSQRSIRIPKKININRETKEDLRKLMNRYKFGLNTPIDPFILTNIYLDIVWSSENENKNQFYFDQFDQENQIIAMLKILKIVYDEC